jgi:hypothetical protein
MKHGNLFISVFLVTLMTASIAVGQDQPRPDSSLPSELSLPAGTLVIVRTTQSLSSDRNKPGDSFTTILDQPIVAQGWVIARRGQAVVGRVVAAEKAGRKNDSSKLIVELSELVLVDGQALPIRTELSEIPGNNRTSGRNEVAAVGTTTGIGAIIGAVAGGGKGAAIGAVIGAAAGTAGVLTTRGRPTKIYPEAELTFRLEEPVIINTEQSRQAFLSVTQRDYSRSPSRNPDRYPEVRNYPPPPPPHLYPRYYDYEWYGPPVYYGVYAGPRYYYGTRVIIRPGHHHRRW